MAAGEDLCAMMNQAVMSALSSGEGVKRHPFIGRATHNRHDVYKAVNLFHGGCAERLVSRTTPLSCAVRTQQDVRAWPT